MRCEMKLFANRRIKTLFMGIFLSILSFVLLSLALLPGENGGLRVLICGVCMAAVICGLCYGYFLEQHKTMEAAVDRIRDYLAGNQEATLECDDEGELYRLFHEVNSLVTILNAHGEKEKRTKTFLQNTISDISHQLKTPLAALNIYNSIIREEAAVPDTVQEFSVLSEQELDRIETLVQQLLKITRLDAGTLVPDKSFQNVSELAADVRQHFLFQANQEGKEIQLSGNSETRLFCDRDWMNEAVSNLVKNALEHTSRGGVIRIEWRTLASIVQITVRDNGSGIHPEDLLHIFKRFYRSRFSQDTPGIGLGLPLTKAIVEAHNGTLEADSTLGVGTCFTMNFGIPTEL